MKKPTIKRWDFRDGCKQKRHSREAFRWHSQRWRSTDATIHFPPNIFKVKWERRSTEETPTRPHGIPRCLCLFQLGKVLFPIASPAPYPRGKQPPEQIREALIFGCVTNNTSRSHVTPPFTFRLGDLQECFSKSSGILFTLLNGPSFNVEREDVIFLMSH